MAQIQLGGWFAEANLPRIEALSNKEASSSVEGENWNWKDAFGIFIGGSYDLCENIGWSWKDISQAH